MGDLARMGSAVLGSMSAVSGTYSRWGEEQAKFDASNIQIRLEREANDFLNELQKSNRYDTWSDDMTAFFEERKSAMENPDSPYYCRNNQTARYVNTMLEQAYNSYQNKVTQMAAVKIRDRNIAAYNESCNTIDTLAIGQANIDQKNDLAKGLLIGGNIDTGTYQKLLEENYYVGTMLNYTANFNDDVINSSIKAGMDFNETWNAYTKNIEKTKKYGIDGLELPSDDKNIKDKAKEYCEQKYNAKLLSVQNQNYDYHENLLTKGTSLVTQLLEGQSVNINDIYGIVNNGQAVLQKMGGLQLAKGQQKSLAKEYEALITTLNSIEKAKKSGSGSSKLDSYEAFLKNIPDGFIAAVDRGEISDLYTAKQAMQNYITKDWNDNIYKESAGLTPEEKREYFETHYESFAANKILNTEVLQKKLKNDPRYSSINTKLELFEKDFKKNPDKYDPSSLSILGELAIDIVASTGKETDMEVQLKNFNTTANALTLSTLKNSFNPQGKGFFGMFGESDESFINRTTKELEENDVVFTDTRGVEQWPAQAKEKIDAISNRQMEIMSGQLGKELSFYEYKKVKNDIEPIPLFKDSNGNVYHYETDKDSGRAVIKDQNGNTVQAISKEDFKAQDKAAKKESRDNMKAANAEYNKAVEARSDKELEVAANTNTMPKGITDLKPEVWASMTASERKANIENVIIALESGNKKTLQKYGVTKEQVKNMSREEKYNLVIGK